MKKLLKSTRSRYPLLKYDLKMKLTLLLVLTALITMHASDTYGQRDKLTLKLSNVTVEQVINEIENNSEFQFVYIIADVDLNRTVSVNAEQQEIDSILKDIFQNTRTTFNVQNRRIYLILDQKENDVGVVGKAVPEIQQQNIVTGTITDKEGQPLPGANIVERGTTNGTQTDFDGNFSIEVGENAVLVVTYIGFATKEISVDGRSSIRISLLEDAAGLEEVVVVGYGTQKKSDLTGAVDKLSSEDFNKGTNVSVDQLIQGRSAGVLVNQTSSEPGGGISVRIRGISSINGGNDPLYVIDGLPLDNSPLLSGGGGAGIGSNPNSRNPLNSINPNDIESIEILKDASATAIYGSRGANGVVMITTKKGEKGKFRIEYDVTGGIQEPNKIDVLTSQDYINVINGIATDSGNDPVFSQADINSIARGTDWQNQIFRSAPITSHDISASGGTENMTYSASFNYFDQEGVVKNSGIKKYIGRLSLTSNIGEKMQVGININTSQINDNNNVDGINNNEQAGPIYSALLYDPTEPVFTGDGSFARSSNLTVNNPLSLIEGISSKNETFRTIVSAYANYQITNSLSAKFNVGFDRLASRRDIYNSKLTIDGAANNGIANIATLTRSNNLFEYTMNYKPDIGESSTIDILGGVTYQNFVNRSFSGNINNFPSDVLLTDNLGLANTENDNLYSNKGDNSLLSYLGRINYSLLDKYLLTASVRADGSSRFGENNKYGYFPSLAAGWKLSEEDFIPDFFERLKLRMSWGLTGNQDIGNYASISTFASSGSAGSSVAVLGESALVGTSPTRIANPDLKWETTEQYDFGIDASILSGRLNITADYFIKTTSDILLNLPLPRASGFSQILSNVGEMENRGFEFLINAFPVQTDNFSWLTTLNFSKIENKVLNIGGSDIITGGLQGIGNTTILREGSPAYSYYGYNVTGIFQANDDIAGSAQPDSRPGYPIFEDVDGDSQITPDDQQIIGNPYPDFTYGFQNSFSYKGFQLDIFIQGQEGNDLLNINTIESLYPANFRRNRLEEQGLNRWTVQNTNTKWPSGVEPSAYGGGKVNTLSLLDGSYIRLKNVQMGYDIPVDQIGFLQSARVHITGQNLLTITNYTGYDPEANAFGRSNVRLDYNSYPLPKTYLIGFNLTF